MLQLIKGLLQNMLKTMFEKRKFVRELGREIILTSDITGYGPFGEIDIIPKGSICLNYGRPSPFYKYDESYVELKLLEPVVDGCFVTDRLVVKRNSKKIKTYNS